ncbi:metal-sensitive transcriptional regulator [Mahella sp.]|uniref:metal-sensitive transcriptional regulator n=1 Tax=Mahella sp. TaxID=2798721 RepID=UPI0025C14AA7|nr:metal-sensitive transcriptional regulator [Mahella sp.]
MLNRLKTIKGHIGGIERMVEEGKECQEVLLQIAAVKASLEKVGYSLLEEHAIQCLVKDNNGKIDAGEVAELINTILKFAK